MTPTLLRTSPAHSSSFSPCPTFSAFAQTAPAGYFRLQPGPCFPLLFFLGVLRTQLDVSGYKYLHNTVKDRKRTGPCRKTLRDGAGYDALDAPKVQTMTKKTGDHAEGAFHALGRQDDQASEATRSIIAQTRG